VAQLYPQALGSLFVASYDSQDYGGGILTRLHTGRKVWECWYIHIYVALVRKYIFIYIYIHAVTCTSSYATGRQQNCERQKRFHEA
jgi:hypothetical protein